MRGGAAALIVSFQARLARAATIVAVRVWPAPDYTRVTLELDRPLKFSWQMVPDPDRLVVDLDGIDLNGAIRDLIAKVQPNDPYIRQVRVGQFQPGVVRIVLDLKVATDPQVFPLTPVANYRHRLVLDLRPAVPIDPLSQLIAQQARRTEPSGPRQALPPPAATPPSSPAAMPPAPVPPASADAPTAADPLDAIARDADLRDRTRPAPTADASARRAPPTSPEPRRPTGLVEAPPDAVAIESGPIGQARAAGAAPRDVGRRPLVTRLLTVAIDAGHGGEDPGAIGARGTQEKDVVLRVARRLRQRIDAEPGMRTFLTRDGDFFVPLGERVRKARGVQADLFVSIHADAFVDPDARGASVFALSERGASSTAARWLARKENASDAVGGVELGSRDREVARLLLDLSTRAQIEHSMRLGRAVLANLSGLGQLHKGQVEQAGFAVLKAPDIPSILVETAFISNPQEEARLNDDAYQARLAEAIFGGIREYFRRWPPAARGRST